MGVPTETQDEGFVATLQRDLDRKREAFEKVLPATVDADRFVDVAATAALEKRHELEDAPYDEVWSALKKCARSGLLPDGEESTLIVYRGRKTTVEWTPMVKGIIRLILRSPGVTKVESRVVREGDEDFEYSYGLNPTLRHTPGGEEAEGDYDDNLTYAYAIVFREGAEPYFDVVPRKDIEKARQTSRAPDSPAWRNWYGEMARKVALHRVSKYVDLAPEAHRAIQQDIEAGWETDYREREAQRARRKVQSDADGRGGRILDEVRGSEEEDEGNGSDESTDSSTKPSTESDSESPDDEGSVSAEQEQGLPGGTREPPEEPEAEVGRELLTFIEDEDLDRGAVKTKDDLGELPADYAIVEYGPTWFHPVPPDGHVREEVSARRDGVIEWCRKHRAADLYGEEHVEADEEEPKPPPQGPDDGDDEEDPFDWTDPEELSLIEARQEMGRLVRRMDGWEFPGFIVRFATTIWSDSLDELPTEESGDGRTYVDVTELDESLTKGLLVRMRRAVEKETLEGVDVASELVD